jgi:hypothetical protein
MPKDVQLKTTAPKVETKVAPSANRNFRARLVYKSGAVQDLLIVATSTNAFDVMRQAFLGYLNSGTPKGGLYTLFPGSIAIDWRDVSSFQDWVE